MKGTAHITAIVLAMFIALTWTSAGLADEVGKGRHLAERLCADCHMNEGQGEKSGPHGIPGFSAVAERPGQTIQGVVAWLESIPPMMPNHQLSQDEMHALAAFILSLRQTTPP